MNDTLLTHAPETVAVIGHGPSPHGRGHGGLIDAMGAVVRMWDHEWQAPRDYGSRTDFAVYTLRGRELSWFNGMTSRSPARAWWAYDPAGRWRGQVPTLARGPRPATVRFHPAEALKVARRLGGTGTSGDLTLTRGTAAAVHAALSLIPRRLVLIGFDDTAAGSVQAVPYAPDCAAALRRHPDARYIADRITRRPAGTVRTHGHDRSVERRVIESMAARVGCAVQWGIADD